MPLKLGGLGGSAGGARDRWVLAAVAVVLVALGAMAWMYVDVTSEREELAVTLEDALRDSTRFADLIARTEQLEAQRDSISQRVEVIQEIDEGRYVWPHVLDEVARALPEYTWLTSVGQVSSANELQFRLSGQAGNNFAVAVFMEQLEASEFIRNVRLIQTEQVMAEQGGSRQVVYSFELEATYVQPPLEALETVPLFGDGRAADAVAAQDTTLTG